MDVQSVPFGGGKLVCTSIIHRVTVSTGYTTSERTEQNPQLEGTERSGSGEKIIRSPLDIDNTYSVVAISSSRSNLRSFFGANKHV